MGEKDFRNFRPTATADRGTKETAKTDGRSTGNNSTDTTGTGTGSGSGTGTGTGSGTGSTKTVKTEKDSKVSVLENLPDVNIPEPQQTKQKRKYTKKTKEEKTQAINSEQFTALIVAISSMVASREGMSHWLISEAEAKQIAEPLANIIEKNESLKVIGEHADAFALVTACLMIVVPRIIITFQTNKAKKEIEKINGTAKHINDRKSTNSNREVPRKDAVTPTIDGKTLFDTISPIQ